MVSLYGLAHQPPLSYDNYLTFTVRKRPRSIWGLIMLAYLLSVCPCFSFQTFWTHVLYMEKSETDGSASEALQTHVQYRNTMYSTWRRTQDYVLYIASYLYIR